MDFIKKTICIEGARTRTQGLMPYYEIGAEYPSVSGGCHRIETLGLTVASGENGNWGQIVANPCFLNGKTYESMLGKYYEMLNLVRYGKKLRKVETKDGEIFTEDIGAFSWNGQCFDGGEEPGFLYDYAAYDSNDFYSVEVDSLREEAKRIYYYSGEESIDDTFIVLIENYDYFLALSKYLSGTTYDTDLSDLDPVDIYSGSIHYEWARYCSVIDLCIGKIDIPSWIYNKHIKAPKSMPCADVEPYITWLKNYQTLSADCCNTRLWEDMGGYDMLEYLETSAETKCKEYSEVLNGLNYSTPYVEMPILLTQNYTDVGVLTNVNGVEYDETKKGPSADQSGNTRPHGTFQIGSCGFTSSDEIAPFIHDGIGVSLDQVLMCDGETRHYYPTTEEYEKDPESYTDESGYTIYPIETESLLQTLRGRKKYTDDKDNVLPGLFKQFDKPAGQMFVCLKGDPSYYQLEVSAQTIVCGETTEWCVKYVENESLSDEDVRGRENFRVSYEEIFRGHLTEQEANEVLSDERRKYEEYGTGESNEYIIAAAAAAWVMSALTQDEPVDCVNADGESNSDVKYTISDDQDYGTAKNKKFRTITTPYSGIRIAMTEEEETGEYEAAYTHYFFMVKYLNDEDNPMTNPYKVGNTTNVYCYDKENQIYRGDFIHEEPNIYEESGITYIEIKYVIGGFFRADENGNYLDYIGGGDIYYEKHIYDRSHVDYVALDGVDEVPVWSEYVDFETDAKEFYSPRLNLYRTGNTANIIEATTGEEWLSGETYDAYLTKEDYLINFSLPPKVDVNVTIDRGGVSAFEKHYKLAECNTMQDLMQYNNGEFFPDNI